MVGINPTILIITLNINGMNAPIKRQRLSEWVKKQDPILCCLQEIHFRYKEKYTMLIVIQRKQEQLY